MMFSRMFQFEVRYFVRQPSFYITTATFLILPFLMMSINRINMAGSNSFKNGPYSIAMMTAFFGALALFLVVNFVANTAIRNSMTKMDELIYCRPIHPTGYQLGRFLGSYFIVLAVFSMVPLGLFLATFMPWLDSDLFGDNHLLSYLLPYLYLSVPTLFVLSCCFYALAQRFQSMTAVNLFAIGMFIAYDLSESLFLAPGFRFSAALMDPFGLRTINEVGRYWTMFEKNTRVLEFTGILLQSRVLWLAVGLVVMVLFGRLNKALTLRQNKVKKDASGEKAHGQHVSPAMGKISYKGQRNAGWQQLLARIRFEFKLVILTPSFLILMIMASTLIIVMLTIPEGMFGTPVWPHTQSMVRLIQNALNIVVMIIIAFYSAEIIWRERETGIGDVIDTLPTHNIHFWLSKLLTVWLVIVLLVCFSMVVTIGYQLINGYTNIDLGQYFVSLFFFSILPWCLMTVLAFLLQVVSTNKYMGMSLFVLFILSSFAMEPLGLAHNMFRFARAPTMTYSDMNGFGWFLNSQFWYMLYWAALSLVMAIVTYGLWHRGEHHSLKQRLSILPYQLGLAGRSTIMASLVLFVFSGSYIYYNTMILNDYTSQTEQFDRQADYEKKYASHANDPVPSITRVNAKVDIYPEIRSIIATAEFTLVNKSAEVIEQFLVSMPAYTPQASIEISGITGAQKLDILKSMETNSGPMRTYWFKFREPMIPGETRTGKLKVTRATQGFVDRGADVSVVKNGTFINNTELFPTFGYQPAQLITDRNERRKRGLPPPKRANKLEDSRFYRQNVFGNGVGFIDFETTLSTSIDQIAIAPGYLQKQWTEGQRAYFHYKMDSPIGNYYAFLSARFEVVKSEHEGVAIEVYHHISHGVNVPRMIESIKASLDYYGKNFGPYQHRQARIIEFPGYRSFAQSFANTIPFSERIGFLSDLRDPRDIDSVYFVTAHEMAHQWWGGQVEGADVQGNTLLSESLAHYSALRVSENKYGKIHSRKILQFELDRYLRERTAELVAEMPWMKVENQPYIHYRKGVVVMNSIRELLGEPRLNAVLRQYVSDFKYNEDPYPTTLDFKSRLDEIATISEKAFLSSLFEQITLYDIKILSARSSETKTGLFDITMVIEAERVKANGKGEETELSMDELIDIGLSNVSPDELEADIELNYLQQHRIKAGKNTLTFTVGKEPKYAVLDPYVRLVDREITDNFLKITPRRERNGQRDLLYH